MEKHAQFLQGSVKKKSGGRIKCTLWIVATVATSFVIVLLGFLVWSLVSYHQHVVNLNSRVEYLENEFSNYKNEINVIVERQVEELLNKVSNEIKKAIKMGSIFHLKKNLKMRN